MIDVDALQAQQLAHERGPMFLGLPDRWYEDATWLCPGGHVSKWYVKSSEIGACCPACMEPVRMVAPETKESEFQKGTGNG